MGKVAALGKVKGKSAASYVAKIVDDHVDENVKTEYKIKEEKQTNA